MEKIFSSKWFNIGILALIAISIIIVYSNTFNSTFHFDDTPNIVENYPLRNLSNFWDILTGVRGVTMITFAINYAINGLDVTGYHIVNTLIHIITAVLAYFLLFHTLMMTSKDEFWSKRISAYAALLFAVHPIQTQSVTYIVQRMESLASLFYLLALFLFVKGVNATTSSKRILFYAGVVASFILGLKSKEIATTLPVVVFLYDWYFVSDRKFKPIMPRLPLYGVLTVLMLYFIVAAVVPSKGFGDLSKESSGEVGAVIEQPVMTDAPSAGFGVKSITPGEYLMTQFNVVLYYITLLIVPANQNLDYDFPISRGFFEMPQVNEGTVLNYPIPPPVVSFIILAAIIAASIYLLIRAKTAPDKRGLVISFFILWFFIILAPTSSFIPIIDVIFEHRVYLASLGFFMVFAVCFDWFFEWLGAKRAGRAGGEPTP